MSALAVTGHRPDKLTVGGVSGYEPGPIATLKDFALSVLEAHRPTPEEVITGMAQGWDTAVAWACAESGLPFVAAIPFKGQESKWPDKAQRTYHWLLGQAAEVVYVCDPGYAVWKMQRRNEWMVDRCSELLALWNGTEGGTRNCIAYAETAGPPSVPIRNVWRDWLRFIGHVA